MRREYRKAVRQRFREAMEARLPEFGLVKIRAPILFAGDTVFRRVAGPDLHTFILLVPAASDRPTFTVEVGWSSLGRFPEISMRPSVIPGPPDPPPLDLPEGVIRLGGLHDGSDLHWRLPDPALDRPGDLEALQDSLEPVPPEEALKLAGEPVSRAMDILLESGISFLDAWVAAASGESRDGMGR